MTKKAWLDWVTEVYAEYKAGNMTTEEWAAFADEAFEQLLVDNEDVLVRLKNI